jgi:hypothetical protein
MFTTMAEVLIPSMAVALTLTGCISGDSHVTYGPKGPPVGSDTLRQIEIGATNKAWLLGALGEPTRESRTSDKTEVLAYEYTKHVDSDFDFCLFFDFDDRREDRTLYIFELEDDIVTRYWKE